MALMARERLVVIGGDAGGMSTASQLRRLNEDIEIVVFDKGRHTSYSACGIPYYVGGMIEDWEDLISITPEEFQERGIDARVMHEVTSIDLKRRTVDVTDVASAKSFSMGWDKLLIATGTNRMKLTIPGSDADGIFTLDTVDSGVRMRKWMEENRPKRAVVIGGGYIGLEMADILSCHMGLDVCILERAPQIMGTIDEDMAKLVAENVKSHGTRIVLGESATEFRTEGGRVKGIRTERGEIETDMVLVALGVLPNTSLAETAGIETGVKGAIVVDPQMRTSAPDVWATGDCVQSVNMITGKPMHLALGAIANRQGRVAALTMAGLRAAMPKVLGTAVCKVCGQEIGRTGAIERELKADGREYMTGTINSHLKAGYMSGAGDINVKLIVDARTEKIVGCQTVGTEGSAKRVDTMATAITAGMTLEDIISLDLSYAPPISPLWDPIQQAARYMRGRNLKKN